MLGLLKKVSRSFYLSLRLLPTSMREGAGLAYLLARASDTIADSADADVEIRLAALDRFDSQIKGESEGLSWPAELVLAVSDESERELLSVSHHLVEWTSQRTPNELKLIRQVMQTIISGQRMDLVIFGNADKDHPAVIASEQDLDDYIYRVAGCVGEFWTHLGFATLGGRFSDGSKQELLELAANYGRGLQLVNILRDLPRDLKQGRCYLPVADPGQLDELLALHQRMCSRAMAYVQDGFAYASGLKGKRLRMASVLPALLAEETLEMLIGADWPKLEGRVKIPRRKVYSNLVRALIY